MTILNIKNKIIERCKSNEQKLSLLNSFIYISQLFSNYTNYGNTRHAGAESDKLSHFTITIFLAFDQLRNF